MNHLPQQVGNLPTQVHKINKLHGQIITIKSNSIMRLLPPWNRKDPYRKNNEPNVRGKKRNSDADLAPSWPVHVFQSSSGVISTQR